MLFGEKIISLRIQPLYRMTINSLFDIGKRNKIWRALPALATIIIAGLLIELISLIQYHYTHRLMETELDYNVENELAIKSAYVKSMLKTNEEMVENYSWPIGQQIHRPEAIYNIIHRLVSTNDDVMSSFVAFVPGYYSNHDRLFETCAIRRGDSVTTEQLASSHHDYTQREFYQQAVEKNSRCWSDPYLDSDASGKQVTTYAVPLTDETGKIVAAFGIDLSTQGIIDTLNTRHNLPSTFFLLLTEEGQLISHPDASRTQHSEVATVVSLINDSTYKRTSSSTGNSKVITFNDKEKGKGYAYYKFMKGQPHWQVVMVCYDNEVYGKLKNMRHIFLLMMLAGLSLLGFILYSFNQYVKQLHESRLIKERTDSELHIAQNIQSEMLPRHEIMRPDIEVSGRQITAMEVGGDLYDYFIRDEKLFFCIGDVSGKGIPSSLVMAVVHTLFRSLSQHESDPSHIMQSINTSSCEGNDTNMFVTLFIGVLDLPTGHLRYCNAGHDAPLLLGTDLKTLPVNANLPVGLFNDFKYSQQQEQLSDGTMIFLYTDGLTEAINPEKKLFGLQRVMATAEGCLEQGQTSLAQVMDAMHAAVTEFADGTKQSDDLTMLALKYLQPQEKEVLHETLKLRNDVHQVPKLNSFVKSVCDKLNLDKPLISQLMLATEEAVVNVMNYAYPMGNEGEITVTACGTEKDIKFIIVDEGKAFDPTHPSEADTSLSAEERPIGGLGILLVQELMDTINYERIDGKNVLTLKKYYKQNNDNNE